MLDDCKYNKIKLLHELSCIAWFLDKCGMQDAEKCGDSECAKTFKALRSDLEKHITALESFVGNCGEGGCEGCEDSKCEGCGK